MLKRKQRETKTESVSENRKRKTIWQEYYKIKQETRQIEEKELETFKIKIRLQELEGSRLVMLTGNVKAQAKGNEN